MTTSNTTGPAPGEPHTAQIIQFSAITSRPRKPIAPSDGDAIYEREELPFVRRERAPLPEPQTETCKNQRLRDGRKKAWNAAHHLTDYYRACIDWESALSTAQMYNVADANLHPKADFGGKRQEFVDLWRHALVAQMLTPAPDVGAVNWKRAHLRAGDPAFHTLKDGQLQRAIDAAAEWLKAHPTRKSIAASRQSPKNGGEQ